MVFSAKVRLFNLLLVLCLLGLIPLIQAFQFFGGFRGYDQNPRAWDFDPDPRAEFQFVRYAYGSGNEYSRRGRGGWRTDYPDAEYHLTNGINRLTMIDTAYGGKYLDPMDDELFEYPWLYAVEVGRWQLADHEAERMREYLLRGGFLMVMTSMESMSGQFLFPACNESFQTSQSSKFRKTIQFSTPFMILTSGRRFQASSMCGQVQALKKGAIRHIGEVFMIPKTA